MCTQRPLQGWRHWRWHRQNCGGLASLAGALPCAARPAPDDGQRCGSRWPELDSGIQATCAREPTRQLGGSASTLGAWHAHPLLFRRSEAICNIVGSPNPSSRRPHCPCAEQAHHACSQARLRACISAVDRLPSPQVGAGERSQARVLGGPVAAWQAWQETLAALEHARQSAPGRARHRSPYTFGGAAAATHRAAASRLLRLRRLVASSSPLAAAAPPPSRCPLAAAQGHSSPRPVRPGQTILAR